MPLFVDTFSLISVIISSVFVISIRLASLLILLDLAPYFQYIKDGITARTGSDRELILSLATKLYCGPM